MKKGNFAVIEALKVVFRQIGRLGEGFRIEKEEALSGEGDLTLEDLRERSKTRYRLELAELVRETQRLRRSIDRLQPAMEEAEDLVDSCLRAAEELRMHLVSAPNRLIRAISAADGSLEREDTVQGNTPDQDDGSVLDSTSGTGD
ncbi:MAG: hypothetical protein AVO35_06500 [Candidatus Aegiribacteria sp. MLS_C]|nr:MAG: hypothetical protein AVO35_06500 [Candidatus Aegiribacteria sp. MLS_C]